MEELQLPPLHEIYEVANKAGMTYEQAEAMRSYAMQAVLAERERCARIVGTLNVAGAYGLRDKLAAAISKGA